MAVRIAYEQTFVMDDGTKLTRDEYIAALGKLGVSYVAEKLPSANSWTPRTYWATLDYHTEDPDA